MGLIHTSPILYRYIDWTITVPLQMIEFYLILSAVSKDITQGSFWKLLIGTVVMLVFGYTGEAHLCHGGAGVGFAGGMCGWFFILFEIFGGEAGTVAGELGSANKYVQSSLAPCASSSPQAGPSTLLATSLATSWVE